MTSKKGRVDKLEYLIKKETKKVNHIQSFINAYQRELNEIEKTQLDTPKECCNRMFYYEVDYRQHRKTIACKKTRDEPNFKCKRCNRLFFDGVWCVEDFKGKSDLYFKSKYRDHLDECPEECPDCGEKYGSYRSVKSHKCRKSTNKRVYTKSTSSISSLNSDDSNNMSELDELFDTESWEFEGVLYDVSTDNMVMNHNGDVVGERINGSLVKII